MNENNEIQESYTEEDLDEAIGQESKKMKIAFKKYIIEIVIFIFIGFLMGFFITEFVFNSYFSYYNFNIETEAAPEYVLGEEYINNRVKALNDYNNYVTEYNKTHEDQLKKYSLTSTVDFEDLSKNIKFEKVSENLYLVKIQARFFKDTFVTSSQKVSKGETKCFNNMNYILCKDISEYSDNKDAKPIEVKMFLPAGEAVKLDNYHNPYLIGLLSGLLMGLITLALFIVTYKAKNKDYFLNIADNEKIFRTPFHKAYWKGQLKVFKNVRDLVILSMLFGMMLVCKLIPIPSGFGTLGLSFTYLFFSIIAMIYGPSVGLIIGIFSDVLGFFIAPTGGVFFPGYTLDAMLAGFTYGICFYKTKVTFTKCLLARFVVNMFINVICGSIWWGIINSFTMEATWTYMLVISLPKNILYLLPQSILLFVVLKAMARPLSAFGLIDSRIKDHITIF